MNHDLRRVHHLTAEESKMLLLFRLLTPAARESLAHLAQVQAEATLQTFDNVVDIASRTIA